MTGLIRTCDKIYGKKISAQCQSQINISNWKGKRFYDLYITKYLKKDIEFFIIYTNLTSVVTCIIEVPTDEELGQEVLKKVCTNKWDIVKGKRVMVWSKDTSFKPTFRSKKGTGHNKQGGIFKDYTYCVKDIGVSWKGKKDNNNEKDKLSYIQ